MPLIVIQTTPQLAAVTHLRIGSGLAQADNRSEPLAVGRWQQIMVPVYSVARQRGPCYRRKSAISALCSKGRCYFHRDLDASATTGRRVGLPEDQARCLRDTRPRGMRHFSVFRIHKSEESKHGDPVQYACDTVGLYHYWPISIPTC